MSNIKDLVEKSLRKRNKNEKRFQVWGLAAIIFSVFFLFIIFGSIAYKGLSAFQQTYIQLDLEIEENGNYGKSIREALFKMFPEVTDRREKRLLYKLVSSNSPYILRNYIENQPEFQGGKLKRWVLASAIVDQYKKGKVNPNLPEFRRKLKDKQIKWLDKLASQDRIKKSFNTRFFTTGDSRNPETAGIGGAIIGSMLTLLITFAIAFPIGVATSIYLEEFAPKNKWSDLIEVNINNLAAVPSIIFGLLGLAIFLNFFHLPRSVPLVGGMVLALMTLPTIIIASRAAIKSVPPSIKEGALAMGATKVQTVLHHTLPLALPGMLTGAIIGMAQALGETAPLLMIGMVAFIVDIPGGVTDPATVLPVQIFLWADSPERAFVERTSAAILVLLGFLVLMNISAVLLRKKFEKSW